MPYLPPLVSWGGGIIKPKKDYCPHKGPPIGYECCLVAIFQSNVNLVVAQEVIQKIINFMFKHFV
jgi:hypothetical protein